MWSTAMKREQKAIEKSDLKIEDNTSATISTHEYNTIWVAPDKRNSISFFLFFFDVFEKGWGSPSRKICLAAQI